MSIRPALPDIMWGLFFINFVAECIKYPVKPNAPLLRIVAQEYVPAFYALLSILLVFVFFSQYAQWMEAIRHGIGSRMRGGAAGKGGEDPLWVATARGLMLSIAFILTLSVPIALAYGFMSTGLDTFVVPQSGLNGSHVWLSVMVFSIVLVTKTTESTRGPMCLWKSG
jgi:hypothetical protein